MRYLEKVDKSKRTRQVQFRMDPDVFKKLYSTIVQDDNYHSMADLFNKAAEEYLEKRGQKNG